MASASNVRMHGRSPYGTAVVHGGPGAAGDMAAVASRLATKRGVLEPLQTALSVDGQAIELAATLQAHARLPATLIGHSWGAWLSIIVAARWPEYITKLILVGSGPFEERYAAQITPERLRRMDDDERKEAEALIRVAQGTTASDGISFSRLGVLFGKADAFDPLPLVEVSTDTQPDIFAAVWPQAAELRRSGALLELASRITCPVVVIHGSYDPHPYDGVRGPLSRVLKDVRFVLLSDCGHTPWHERLAREDFYHIIEDELPPA